MQYKYGEIPLKVDSINNERKRENFYLQKKFSDVFKEDFMDNT